MLSDMMLSDAAVFVDTDGFGEPAYYIPRHPADATPRAIKCVVDRDPPTNATPDGKTVSPKMTLEIPNTTTGGISATEFNSGGDKIRIAYRIGGTVEDFYAFKPTDNKPWHDVA